MNFLILLNNYGFFNYPVDFMVDFKHYGNVLKEEIKLAFTNNKYFLLVSVLIFIIPMILGYIYADKIASYIQPMVDTFEKNVEDGTVTLATDSIFINNLTVSVMLYALSALGAVLGIVILANNGMFIGFYGTRVPLDAYIILTLPHGIFEVPSIIIATTAGFTLLSFALHFIYNILSPDYSHAGLTDSDGKLSVKGRISQSLNKNQHRIKESFILFCISVVLLIIAAFIEANLTLPLANWIYSFMGNGTVLV